MSYLLDTNVLSELRRKTPNNGVVQWFSKRPTSTLYLSVLTLGELRKGAESAIEAEHKMQLLDWIETDLIHFFSGRILNIDAQIAYRWGTLIAQAGRPLPAIDSLIGATASHHGLSLVTRNTKDFANLGLDIINPWNS